MARRYARDVGEFGEHFVERERQNRFNKVRSNANLNLNMDDKEMYYLGVVQISPEKATQILTKYPPPPEYSQLKPIERTAYLYYFMLYRKYFTPVVTFYRVFNRELFKYTANGDSETVALQKICSHTYEEYKQKIIKQRQMAYSKSQKRMFSDESDSPESRNSVCDRDSDLNSSVDTSCKGDQVNDIYGSLHKYFTEPLLYRVPHRIMRFAVGGKVVFLDPEKSVSTVLIDDAKNFFLDNINQRNIAVLESFKGPMLVGKTPPQTALLFIERQIDRIKRSEIYRGHQHSGDADDCLLIWNLLKTLVLQQGKVTGPDLARLLMSDYSYSSVTAQNFMRESVERPYDSSSIINGELELRNEQSTDMHAMDRFAQYLLGGHLEEAIESAMHDGLLFDALLLANRIFRNDSKKLGEIEARLLKYRAPQHPVMTLMSVANETPVPILANTTADDANGWRAHIAIILANLQTESALRTVYDLGIALAQKEFNSAADFCFLAVNLLTGKNCFHAFDIAETKAVDVYRKHIKLISASLPDDQYNSTQTRFGWSLLDYQATELFEYALSMAAQGQRTVLAQSLDFQKCRLQYAELLSEYGGFASSVSEYCTEIARSIWDRLNDVDVRFMLELCQIADRHQFIGNCESYSWITELRSYISSMSYMPTMLSHCAMTEPNVAPSQHYETATVSPFEGNLNMLENMSIHKPIPTASRKASYAAQSELSYDICVKKEVSSVSHTNADSHTVHNNVNLCESRPEIVATAVPQAADYNHTQQEQFSIRQPEPVVYERSQEHSSQRQAMSYDGQFYSPYNGHEVFYDNQQNPAYAAQPEVTYENRLSTSPDVGGTDDHDQFVHYQNNDLTSEKQGGGGANNDDFDSLPLESRNGMQSNGSASGGLFSGLTSRLVKYIPTGNSMKLPDDKDPQIRWDPDRGRYVGDGVEEELDCPPPPIGMSTPTLASNPPTAMTMSSSSSQQQQEQLQPMPIPMIPIPSPDGAVMPAAIPLGSKKNGRLPQKRYQSGF